jgi:hypothetical protein
MDFTDTIDVDLQKQIQPYFVFRELKVTQYGQYINFTSPYGFGYLLRRLTMNYNNATSIAGVLHNLNPMLSVEFFDTVGVIARQVNPIAFNLISTPSGNTNTVSPVPLVLPVPLKGYRITHKILNYYWCFGNTVQLQITGAGFNDINDVTGSQIDLQILLEGYFIPEPKEKGAL